MASNSDPNKAPGHSAFNQEEMTREQSSPLSLESEEWLGPGLCGPMGKVCAGLQPLPSLLPPVPLSACRAGMCQIACICKMWACRAGRRKFPLKHLIFKRNEARASKHSSELGTLGSVEQLPEHEPSWSHFVWLWSKSDTNRAEILLSGETIKNIHYSLFLGHNPPGLGSQGWVI